MITTYTELKTRVREWVNHSKVTDDKAAEFIAAAERTAYRDLRIQATEVTTTPYDEGVTATADKLISSGAETFTLTADIAEVKDVWTFRALTNATPPPTYTYGTRCPEVGRTSLALARQMLYDRAYGEYPRFFGREGSTFVFAPVPADFFVRMTYWGKPAALSDSAPSNVVLTTCPELLLYGAVAEGFAYVRLYEDADRMTARFLSELERLNAEARRAEWSGGGLVQRATYNG